MTLASLEFSFASIRRALADGMTAEPIIAEACRRARACAGEGIFTALVEPGDAIGRARQLQAEADAGAELPLLGMPFSVKDSIHVAGMPTTSNCPALRLLPKQSAPAVTMLEQAGAVLIGKNTLDQFATGLNGTRSPDPICRNAIDPAFIPGGSSSGSAVAVARGIVAFSLGTDTGGSGRVPAACNGIVGLKPTIGLVSSRGLIYNNRSLDCIPVFAGLSDEAFEVLEQIAGFDVEDPLSRLDADRIDLEPRPSQPLTLAVPRADQLKFFGDDEARHSYESNLATLVGLGHRLSEVDFTVFEQAGRLVFQSAMVAERLIDYADVVFDRARLQLHRKGCLPGAVCDQVGAAAGQPAVEGLRRHGGADGADHLYHRPDAGRSDGAEHRNGDLHLFRQPARHVRGGRSGPGPLRPVAVFAVLRVARGRGRIAADAGARLRARRRHDAGNGCLTHRVACSVESSPRRL
jgi:allophanate hydrolase